MLLQLHQNEEAKCSTNKHKKILICSSMKNTRDRIDSYLDKYNWKTLEIEFTASLLLYIRISFILELMIV